MQIAIIIILSFIFVLVFYSIDRYGYSKKTFNGEHITLHRTESYMLYFAVDIILIVTVPLMKDSYLGVLDLTDKKFITILLFLLIFCGYIYVYMTSKILVFRDRILFVKNGKSKIVFFDNIEKILYENSRILDRTDNNYEIYGLPLGNEISVYLATLILSNKEIVTFGWFSHEEELMETIINKLRNEKVDESIKKYLTRTKKRNESIRTIGVPLTAIISAIIISFLVVI